MAWIPMYLHGADIEFLNDWLNQEEEIAFLISNGHKKWIAKKEHNISEDLQNPQRMYGFLTTPHAEYHLWHIPSGPLPIIQPHGGVVTLRLKEEDWKYEDHISNPWEGWTEKVTGNKSHVPYFESHPGIIELSIIPTDQYRIYVSHFGWIGNHNSILGNKGNPVTHKFWGRLRRMVKKASTHIPRQNNPLNKNEIYAFPNALKEIQQGKICV